MRNAIDFKRFIEYVHQECGEKLSIEGIDFLLELEEGYNKDNPISSGKHLVLNRLVFSGTKRTGEDVLFDQILYKGLNVWIADNHKGKSTIFKIIKFALTGRDRIKRDVSPWIDDILLEFNVGKVTYTCHIDNRSRARGDLYRFPMEEYWELARELKLDLVDKSTEFSFSSKGELEEKLQEFFFKQFSFYSMKYTQKDSAKDSFELRTSNLSWATYYKSIYLESSNYEYLFFDDEDKGAQGQKIFEMILGLPLTYPINALSLRRDRVKEEIGKLKMNLRSQNQRYVEDKKTLEDKLKNVEQQLKQLSSHRKITFDEKPLIEEYSKTQVRVNEIRKQQRLASHALQQKKHELELVNEEFSNLEKDQQRIKQEISTLKKQENELDLYQQTESFFTNLDIKSCPHCETSITDERKQQEHEHHICGLCGETSKVQKVEEAEIMQKLERIASQRKRYEERLERLQITTEQKRKYKGVLQKTTNDLYAKVVGIPSTETDTKKLLELEQSIEAIQTERFKLAEELRQRDRLIAEQAILKFRLSKISDPQIGEQKQKLADWEIKDEILGIALSALKRKRIDLNKDILSKLEILMINEIHAFGLTSIARIKIGTKYNLAFVQNDVVVSFKELTEGEKLRVKLAFYLSLIQLDIEHNLGRHPRFLIFDSPGSEEMVPKHLHGLSEILKGVNERFKDKLQIFIGSALREFASITDEEKRFIRNEDQFVF